MMIKYLLNTFDTALPVYEVNYASKTWKVVSFRRRQYGDDFISGKLRKDTDFAGAQWKEVPKPQTEPGRRTI